MDKVITRLTLVIVMAYFILSYIFAQMGIDILRSTYVLLFELCVVSYTFCSGRFHCRYMRWTALSILLVDIISHTDYYFDYIPISVANIIPIGILALGCTTSLSLAIRHFYKVSRLKRMKDGRV